MLQEETIYPGGTPPEKEGFIRKILNTKIGGRPLTIGEAIVDIMVILLVYVLIYLVFNSCTRCTREVESTQTASFESPVDTLSTIADSVFTYIFLLRLEHPRIVMAQCIEESGNFTSLSFRNGHNCTGMKVPSRRPTLAVGTLYYHARFNSWQECLMDYAIWQSIYARGKTADEYLAYLDTVYAEKKGYSNRLRKIIETRL